MNRLLILAKSTENNEYNWIWCEWKVYMSLCIPRRNVCIPLVFFCSAMNVCVRNGQKLQKLNVHIFSHVKNQLLTIVAESSEKFLKFFNFERSFSKDIFEPFSLVAWRHWHVTSFSPIEYREHRNIYILIRYWMLRPSVRLSVCPSVRLSVCSFAIETTFLLSNFKTKHIFGILMKRVKFLKPFGAP